MNLKSNILPKESAGLLREHRLYQADWLIRFYGFKVNELISEEDNLSLDYDPKCAWALSHPELFPVEINTAPVEMLVRVPGIGLRSAYKIISARRYGKLTLDSLKRMKIPLKRALNFITTNGYFLGSNNPNIIKTALLTIENAENYTQLSMFSNLETFNSALHGEL